MLIRTALLLANLVVPSAQALGFHETMHLAFEKNLRTEANKLQIEAMRARTAAAWKRLLPTLSFSYSYANSRYSNFDGTQTTFGRSSTRGGSYAVSANLYNGGADYFAALAAESAKLAQEAQLNSTNAFIPNTKGAIANLVASSYFSILAQLSAIDFFNERLSLLTDLLRVAQTTQDKRALQVQVESMTIELQRSVFSLEEAKRDYQFAVNDPAPDQLDSFDVVMDELKVPPDAASAFAIAKTKSPALVADRHQLKATELSGKSLEASLTRPRVDASITRDQSTSWSPTSFDGISRSTRIGVSASWTLDLAAKDLIEGAKFDALAATRNLEATEAELEYRLTSIYAQLESQTSLNGTIRANFERAKEDIALLKQKIANGTPIEIPNTLDRVLRNYDENYSQFLNSQMKLVNIRFNLQRTIGTLFDEIHSSIERKRNGGGR